MSDKRQLCLILAGNDRSDAIVGGVVEKNQIIWCPGPELNRYVLLRTRDFKSRASASFATRAT